MCLIGVIAIATVIVQSCQPPKDDLERFAVKSLHRLTVLETPPPQPTLKFTGADATPISLSDFRGQYILLNVWATWCAPCVVEIPSLNALQTQRGGDNFQVITISLDRTQQEAQQFLQRNQIDKLLPIHDASFSLQGALEVPGLPLSVIYDPYGREIARLPGEADWASPEALDLIDYLITR